MFGGDWIAFEAWIYGSDLERTWELCLSSQSQMHRPFYMLYGAQWVQICVTDGLMRYRSRIPYHSHPITSSKLVRIPHNATKWPSADKLGISYSSPSLPCMLILLLLLLRLPSLLYLRRTPLLDVMMFRLSQGGTGGHGHGKSVVGPPWRLTQHRPISFFLASLRR